jgi:hypothetical protein
LSVVLCDHQPRPGAQVNSADSSVVLARSVEHLGELPVREPMIAEHPGGVPFVSGFAALKATFVEERRSREERVLR